MKNREQKIKTLIADDENPARKRLRELLVERSEFEIVGECSSGEETIKAVAAKAPDLVFLDIHLQDMNGFEVLEDLSRRENLPLIVFVTAYDQYAIRAFEFHALDYLLKPFDDERFAETLDYAVSRIKHGGIEKLSQKISGLIADFKRDQERTPSGAQAEYQNRLVLRSAGKIAFIETRDIDWISAEGYYVSIRVGGKSHLMRESLKNLERILDPRIFLRIHRSTIVNIKRIKELHSHFHGEFFVILKDGKRFKLSRGYRENAERLLDGHF
ncbi:MAG: LytTR family DNA-binding domain-containing protein [Pyrinomonadaceae bacterium]